jgi:hypothetical protein
VKYWKQYWKDVALYAIVFFATLTAVMMAAGAFVLLVDYMFLKDNAWIIATYVQFIYAMSFAAALLAAKIFPWPLKTEESPYRKTAASRITVPRRELIRNAAQCNNCGDVIESKHCHDFVSCSCFKNETDNKGIAVDGGLDYARRVGNLDDYTELSEYREYRVFEEGE